MVRASVASAVQCLVKTSCPFNFVEGEHYFMSPAGGGGPFFGDTTFHPNWKRSWIIGNRGWKKMCIVSDLDLKIMRGHFVILEVDQSACNQYAIELEDGLLASWLD